MSREPLTFEPKVYLNAVRNQFSSFMKPEQLRQVMRTAAKRLAKHHGHISKYDGQGRLREGFPAAGDTGSRPTLPYQLAKWHWEQEAHVKRRRAKGPTTGGEARRARMKLALISHGPSRKMFVARTDGGNGP